MFCNECGKQIPDEAKFCNYCGSPTAKHLMSQVNDTGFKKSLNIEPSAGIFQRAQCTGCGANLDVDDGLKEAKCPYCGATFIVQQAINKYMVSANKANLNISGYASIHVGGINVQSYLNAAKDLINNNHFKEAYTNYTKVLEIEPDNTAAVNGISDLYDEMIRCAKKYEDEDNYVEAYNVYRCIVDLDSSNNNAKAEMNRVYNTPLITASVEYAELNENNEIIKMGSPNLVYVSPFCLYTEYLDENDFKREILLWLSQITTIRQYVNKKTGEKGFVLVLANGKRLALFAKPNDKLMEDNVALIYKSFSDYLTGTAIKPQRKIDDGEYNDYLAGIINSYNLSKPGLLLYEDHHRYVAAVKLASSCRMHLEDAWNVLLEKMPIGPNFAGPWKDLNTYCPMCRSSDNWKYVGKKYERKVISKKFVVVFRCGKCGFEHEYYYKSSDRAILYPNGDISATETVPFIK